MATCSEPTKVCAACKIRRPWSAYYAKRKWPDGTTRQPHSRCRDCFTAAPAHRAGQRRYAKRKHARIKASPEEWAAHLRKQRDEYHERREDPEWWGARRAQITEAKRRRLGITPDRYRDGKGLSRSGEFLPAEPFAEWLRWVMAADGLDRGELADFIGVSVGTVARILNGRQDSVDLMTVDAALQRDERRTIADLYG